MGDGGVAMGFARGGPVGRTRCCGTGTSEADRNGGPHALNFFEIHQLCRCE